MSEGYYGADGNHVEGEEPGDDDEQPDPEGGHHGVVEQRSADGHVSVVGHQHQEGEVGAGGGVQHEALQQAAPVGDGRGGAQDVPEELGVKAGRPVQAVDAQVAQEDVHGFVESFIQNNDANNGHVDHPDHTVVQQREEEQRESVVSHPAEAGQREHADYANIIHHMVRGDADRAERLPSITSAPSR